MTTDGPDWRAWYSLRALEQFSAPPEDEAEAMTPSAFERSVEWATVPHWVEVTPAQLARARQLVADRRAAWIDPLDYPAQATAVLQLRYRDPHGNYRGKVYVDQRGQAFGAWYDHGQRAFTGSYTWREARGRPMLLVHRGYELRPDPHVSGSPMGWAWVHASYDGPPDDRCGWSPTLAEARRDIDGLIRETKPER